MSKKKETTNVFLVRSSEDMDGDWFEVKGETAEEGLKGMANMEFGDTVWVVGPIQPTRMVVGLTVTKGNYQDD